MKNKLIIIFTVTALLLLFSVCFAANPKVQIDGKIIDFTDENGNKVEAQLINNRTMVPLRKIFEELECEINWDQATKTVTATKDSQKITLTIGEKEAYATDYFGKNEEKIILDSEPVIVDNRTLVPFRFIGESLGCDVGWDQANQTAIIISYKEFANTLKNKFSLLGEEIAINSISVEKKYYDDADPSRNSNTKVIFSNGELDASGNTNMDVKVMGSSEFVKEVENEGWNDFHYTISSDNNYISSNYVFSQMFESEKNKEFKIDYAKYELTTNVAYSPQEWCKRVTNLDTSNMNVNTYKEVKADWDKFINTFTSKSKKLAVADFEYKFLRVENIANIRVYSESINGLLLLNKVCFRLNLNFNDMLFDYPSTIYEFSQEGNSTQIKISLKNEYKERIEYIVNMQEYNY